jgi:sugar phosphate isomerase/epimerase
LSRVGLLAAAGTLQNSCDVSESRPTLRDKAPRVGLVAEAFADQPLAEVMDWLVGEVPEVTDLEIGTGGYAPTGHCDLNLLLRDASERRDWLGEITGRGLRIGALNVWGNPLHPDPDIAKKHASDLRDTIRLAAEIDVDRVVALAGCPAGAAGDRTPHFDGGGWLPFLEGVYESQWDERVVPYWSALANFAHREHPDLLVCLELHPGTVVYNVETFERIAALGVSIAANIDPSHFFWMGMDPVAVVRHLAGRIGHCHGKDAAFSPQNLALNGLLDHRWPRPPEAMPWNFAVVGRGRPEEWWGRLVAELVAAGGVHTIAIEHEDPFVAARAGVQEAAALLTRAIASSHPPAVSA